MRNSLKGPLLSGLVLPGLGQIALKQYRRGIALVAAVVTCLAVIIAVAVQQALAIVDKIEAAGGAPDADTVAALAAQASAGPAGLLSNVALTVLLACWIVAVVDAYRIGRRLDRSRGPAHGGPVQ